MGFREKRGQSRFPTLTPGFYQRRAALHHAAPPTHAAHVAAAAHRLFLLVRDCKDLGKNVVVILISGRVLAIVPELALSDAFIAAWLPGSEGAGVADFLFAVNGFKPTGKSPYAWPAHIEDLPPTMFDERALFPFGFGLQEY